MPLIRCDYSKEHLNDDQLQKLVQIVFDASAELCHYNEQDAQDKISIFNTPFGPADHSTASIEIEIRAKVTEFDRPPKSRQEVRAEWLKRYEDGLIPFAQQVGLTAPIILSVTFEDWEVVVVTSAGSVPN